MSLKFYNNTISEDKNVKVYTDTEALKMYGNEVWHKKADEWETLFSGSKEFTASGSLYLPALKSTDTVQITAEVIFCDYYGKAEDSENEEDNEVSSEYITCNITEQKIPYSVGHYYAYVQFEYVNQYINFEFHDYFDEFKGIYTYQTPYKVIIKEVRRKV